MTWAGFVGADPVGLLGLADTVDQYAARISMLGTDVERLLVKHNRATPRGRLADFARELDDEADELRWRAAAINAAQRVGARGSLDTSYLRDRAVFATIAVFDLSTRTEAFRQWTRPPGPDDLERMTPRDVAAAIAGLTPTVVEFLVDQYPEVIGALDGVPAEVRYSANRILIEREIARLEAEVDQISANQTSRKLWWLDPKQVILWSPVPSLIETVARRLEERASEYQKWLDEDRQILLFDPVGDGRVAEVFGNLATASRVGVVVPGMANDIVNFSDCGGGFRANAAHLYGASVSLGRPDVATIAWLGYDTPDGIDALSADAATAGAPALARLLQGIDPQSDTRMTVVAHSYGSVLAGLAAQEGLDVNDLVFVGSPGTTLDAVADATIRPGGTVWSALARNDPIGAGISLEELPPWWVPPLLAPGWLISDLTIGGAEELWHGPNPVSDEFGAREISTRGGSGHSSYFKATSLLNLARITQGLYSEVELAD